MVKKVLGIYFCREGIAQNTWDTVTERAKRVTYALQQLGLTLREKALATKTALCGYANYASRVGVMPRKTANQLNQLRPPVGQ